VTGSRTVVLARTAAAAVRSAVVWGVVFGTYVLVSAFGYASTYPTVASRRRFATSLATNAGIAALVGPARRLDTVAGFTSWRTTGVLSVVGAVWGLLLATRLGRGEEDLGRWELYLVGHTSRSGAAAQSLAGLGAGLASLWALTAIAAAAAGSASSVGIGLGAALYLAVALVAAAAMFVALGALFGQLAGSRRQANAVGAGVLGASYLLRMVADSGSGLAWLRWTSPLGWVEELRPLTGPRPVGLIPVAALALVAAAAAFAVAARRDLGASLLPARTNPLARTGLLGGPGGLSLRLGRSVVVAWIAGLAVLGLVLGLVAQSAASAISGSAAIQKAISRLGGHGGGAAAYLGFAFVIAAALVAFAAAGQVAAVRSEEAEGRVDHLLVRAVSRRRWLIGRVALGAALVVGCSTVAGVAAFAGAASQHDALGFGRLLQAGLNIAPPALLVLGVGVFAFGWWPRAAAGLTYAVVAWSLLVELVGSVLGHNRLLLDSSVFFHVAPAPAADPNWVSAGWLVLLGVVAVAVGVVGFERRDLAGA